VGDKSKNIQIPLELFNRLVDVLGYIDTSNYTEDFRSELEAVLDALRDKKRRMGLREDYKKLVDANKSGDEGKQIDSRIKYLRNRNDLQR
jgi:hypothetical protein